MLALWKKSCGKPRRCIKKQRHHFVDKISIVKAMGFPVVMYGSESWTTKKTEGWINVSEMCCWRRPLRVPWTARRSNQSILMEINPGYSLEGLMLKLLYFGHLMPRSNSKEKPLMLGNIESRRRRGQQRMSSLDCLTNSMDVNLSKLRDREDRGAWCAAVHGVAESQSWT